MRNRAGSASYSAVIASDTSDTLSSLLAELNSKPPPWLWAKAFTAGLGPFCKTSITVLRKTLSNARSYGALENIALKSRSTLASAMT